MNNFWKIALIIGALLVGAYLYLRTQLEKLTVSVAGVKIKTLDINLISGNIKLKINNPFGRIELSDLEAGIYLDKTFLTSVKQVGPPITEDNNKTIFINLSFEFLPHKVFTLENAIGALSILGKNKYIIKGNIKVSKLGVTGNLPINYELPAFKNEK